MKKNFLVVLILLFFLLLVVCGGEKKIEVNLEIYLDKLVNVIIVYKVGGGIDVGVCILMVEV